MHNRLIVKKLSFPVLMMGTAMCLMTACGKEDKIIEVVTPTDSQITETLPQRHPDELEIKEVKDLDPNEMIPLPELDHTLPADDWTKGEILFGDAKISPPYDYRVLRYINWELGKQMNPHRMQGYKLAPGKSQIYEFYNKKYGLEYGNAAMDIAFTNNNDKECLFRDCPITDITISHSMVSKNSDVIPKGDPRIMIANRIHFGSPRSEAINAFGTPTEELNIPTRGGESWNALKYESDNCDLYLGLDPEEDKVYIIRYVLK